MNVSRRVYFPVLQINVCLSRMFSSQPTTIHPSNKMIIAVCVCDSNDSPQYRIIISSVIITIGASSQPVSQSVDPREILYEWDYLLKCE